MSVQPSNSRFQWPSVDRGATTRKGPRTPWRVRRDSSAVTVWMVLPRPISSARMQLRRWNQEKSIQFTPSSWYSRSVRPDL